MKYLILFENFKVNNITSDDVIKCINNKGTIYVTTIRDMPDHDPKDSVTPLSIDSDGLVTIELGGENYEVELKDIERIIL